MRSLLSRRPGIFGACFAVGVLVAVLVRAL